MKEIIERNREALGLVNIDFLIKPLMMFNTKVGVETLDESEGLILADGLVVGVDVESEV